MIGFGFGVGKLSDVLEQKDAVILDESVDSGIIFGEAFISLGIFSLLAAVVQYWRILKRIDHSQYVYAPSRALPMMTAISLLLIGLFGFIAVLL